MATAVSTDEQTAEASPARSAYRYTRAAVWWLLILGALVGFFNAFDSELGPWEGWAAWLLTYWLVVLLHELGHAVAALVCRWKIVVFAAGPIGFQFHNREFAFIPRSKRDELAGFVFAMPTNRQDWTRVRNMWIVAGGPIANLLLAAVAFAGGVVGETAENGRLNSALLAVGLMSSAMAFNSLTPSSRTGRSSDIQQLRRLARMSDQAFLRQRAVGWLYGLAKHKVRLRELPLWMLDEAQEMAEHGDASARFAVEALHVGIVLDSPPVDLRGARNLLNQFRDEHGASAWLDCCDAYFTAVWEADPVAARAKLWHGEMDRELRPLALAAEASVLAREGDNLAAMKSLKQMRESLERTPFTDRTFRDIGRQIEALLTE